MARLQQVKKLRLQTFHREPQRKLCESHTGNYTQLVKCLWGVNKKQIPNRIRGKSCGLLQSYLAQQWWKSIHGTYGPELFQKILPILKENNYKDVKEQIKLLKQF